MLFVIPKMFCIFVVPMGLHPPADIFIDESVLAFILEWKSGKFQLSQGKQRTRHSVLHSIWGVLPHTHSIRVWGMFICDKVFQNLHSDRLIDSTLSFFSNLLFRGQIVIKF